MPTTDATCLTRSGFNLDIAVFLAEASAAAYGEKAVTETWARGRGFKVHEAFDRSNIQGFWCTAGDMALLAFRGTSNIKQWIRDAQLLTVAHPWGQTHKGFTEGLALVEQDLQLFDVAAAKARHVWITGHSLGGGLALLAAARQKMKGIRSSIYTYGQPRVGLSGFAERFAIELPGRLHRFVNQSDIVTRLPPEAFFYNHTGIVKRIVRPGVLELALESARITRTLQMEWSIKATSALGLGLESSLVPASSMASLAQNATLDSKVFETALAVVGAGLTESMFIDCELPSLTAGEFATLQLSLQTDSGILGMEGMMLEGLLPWFDDHSITEYIRLLTEIRDQETS